MVPGGFVVETGGASPADASSAATLVNAAGLHAQAVAAKLAGLLARHHPARALRQGALLRAGRPVAVPAARLSRSPSPAGSACTSPWTSAGQARFGPDVSWVDGVDYSFDEGRAAQFYAAIRRYWPGLPDGALQPGYTGIRPKLGPAGTPAHDFVIQGPADHGVPGLVNLYGIESPGLTASLAIADAVASLVAA